MSDQKSAPVSSHRGIDEFMEVEVNNDDVKYGADFIEAQYVYSKNLVRMNGNKVKITPKNFKYQFRTERKVNKTGMMLVGWGGNNGSTITGGILANKHKLQWQTKHGMLKSNYYGSLTQATTVRIGATKDGQEVHMPFKNILPMVDPNDLVIGGWDINNANLAQSMARAEVFHPDLQRQLTPMLENLTPLPSIYYPDFIAANQNERANNTISGTKQENLEQIRKDIREFKANNGLDKVILLWTANTERFTDVKPGLNLTADEILNSIKNNAFEVSPSQIFAVASILEGSPYINGSPQNSLVPGVIDLAKRHNVFIAGDDFKSGQTKMKSVLVDFLVSAGIKPMSIVSYNHLGNNDGFNLSAPKQFRSKEISKSNVVDDMVASNHLLYDEGEHPDHVVVIKYVPFVKDSKRAMDEYTSRIFMNGLNTIVMHNTCEDSLLASPLIMDLVLITELATRIKYKTEDMEEFDGFHPVLSLLAYLLKAPVVPEGTPIFNALFKQQRFLTNLLCVCAGLAHDTDMILDHITKNPKTDIQASL